MYFLRPTRVWEDNIKKDSQKIGSGVEYIDLSQDRDSWLALVKAVINRRVSIKCGENLGIAEKRLASREGLCCILTYLLTYLLHGAGSFLRS